MRQLQFPVLGETWELLWAVKTHLFNPMSVFSSGQWQMLWKRKKICIEHSFPSYNPQILAVNSLGTS